MHFLIGFAGSAQKDTQASLLYFWLCGPSSPLHHWGEVQGLHVSSLEERRISEQKSRFIQSGGRLGQTPTVSVAEHSRTLLPLLPTAFLLRRSLMAPP